MPSTYAHRYFGEKVRAQLTGSAAEIIDHKRELFDIGLHGPDILFYHKPLLYNRVNQLGRDMHKEKGRRFFGDVKPQLAKSVDPEGALSYILGFICHFALDSQCHPYVDQAIEKTGVSHMEIETEFDKMLMRRDGFDPWIFDSASHLHTSRQSSEVIAPLLGVSEKDAYAAVKGMKGYAGFFKTTNPVTRGVSFFFLKISGLSKNIRGLFLNKKDHPKCKESSLVLAQKLDEAVPLGAALIENYMDFLEGEGQLSDSFERTYE